MVSRPDIQCIARPWLDFQNQIHRSFNQIYHDCSNLTKAFAKEYRSGIAWKICAAGTVASLGVIAVAGAGIVPVACAIAFFGASIVAKLRQNDAASLIGRVKTLEGKVPPPPVKFKDFTEKLKPLYDSYMQKQRHDYENNLKFKQKEELSKELSACRERIKKLGTGTEAEQKEASGLIQQTQRLEAQIKEIGDVRQIRQSLSQQEFLVAHAKNFPVSSEQWRETAMRFFAMRCYNMVKNGGGELLQKTLQNDSFFDYSFKSHFKKGDTVHVLGDIQGGVGGLVNYLTQLKIDNDFKLPPEAPHIVLIGDYTDGSPFGHEVWYLLMELSLQNPDKVTMIKGNHEVADLSNHDEFGHKFLDSHSNDFATWRRCNTLAIRSLASVLPSLFLAKTENDKIAWFSHSWDPKAYPELKESKAYSEVHYSDLELMDLQRNGEITVADGANPKQSLEMPKDKKPGDGFGVNKSLLAFRPNQKDLVPAFGDGSCFFTPKVLEACKHMWRGHNDIQYMTFGHVSEPTHTEYASGIAMCFMNDGTLVSIVDASFDDIATSRYLIPAQVYDVTENGWECHGRHVIQDVHGFYKYRPVEKDKK